MSETPQTPTPEHFYGTVMPGGRGMEQHGVSMHGTPDLIDQHSPGEDVEAIPLPPPPDPIPVQIIRTGGRELKRWRTNVAHVAPSQPNLIAGRDETRDSIRIQNLSANGADVVWVAPAQHLANAEFGYRITPGSELVLNTEDPIYCSGDAAAAAIVRMGVLIEYTVTEH